MVIGLISRDQFFHSNAIRRDVVFQWNKVCRFLVNMSMGFGAAEIVDERGIGQSVVHWGVVLNRGFMVLQFWNEVLVGILMA